MDIGSKNSYPAGNLSNFTPHPFIFDDVECASMEGFLQSLKFKNPEMQKYVCTLVGIAAKRKGSKKKWYRTQTLWWKGKEIDRHDEEYQNLLDNAYIALSDNYKFKQALRATGNAVLTHRIGKSNPHQTILTEREFCSRLTKLRKILFEEEN